MMNHLVVGHLGQIGSAIFELLQTYGYGYHIVGYDIRSDFDLSIEYKFDVVHICIPYNPERKQDFFDTVRHIMRCYANSDTILLIHSTVDPDVSEILNHSYLNVVYSPVRGRHEDGLIHGLQTYIKYYITPKKELLSPVKYIFNRMNIPSYGIHGEFRSLEFAKLANTLWHFMNVAYVQELIMLAEEYDLDLSIIVSFIESTMDRKVYPYAQAVGDKEYDHCLIPNAEILQLKGSKFAEFLLERNREFKKRYGYEKKILKKR